MKFYSQWNKVPEPKNREKTSEDSLVTRVQVLSNSQRIAQMVMSGAMIEAGRVGYQWQHDEQLGPNPTVMPGKGIDIVEKIDFINRFQEGLKAHIATYNAKKAAQEATKQETEEKPQENAEKSA